MEREEIKINQITNIVKKEGVDLYTISYMRNDDVYFIQGKLMPGFQEPDMVLSEDINEVNFFEDILNLIQSKNQISRKYSFIPRLDAMEDGDTYIPLGYLKIYNFNIYTEGSALSLSFKIESITKSDGEEVKIEDFPMSNFIMAIAKILEAN